MKHTLLFEFIVRSLKSKLVESTSPTSLVVIEPEEYKTKFRDYLDSKVEDPNDPVIIAKHKRYHQNHVDWVAARKAEGDKDYADYEVDPFEFNPYTSEMAEEEFETSLKTTLFEMEKIKTKVEDVIQALGDQWFGSKVVISPYLSFDSKYSYVDKTATSSAEIIVGTSNPPPSFILFQDEDSGKLEIGDALDAGDEDFFDDPRTESDYFNLVKFIKNPSAINAKGKILRLYTARPKRDRSLYVGATTLPTNIFLTSSESAAEGIAVELQGTDKEPRDVYLVKIDSRYVRLTLDSSSEKQYQTVAPVSKTVPVKDIIRIS